MKLFTKNDIELIILSVIGAVLSLIVYQIGYSYFNYYDAGFVSGMIIAFILSYTAVWLSKRHEKDV